jgi:hypothetical protein
VDRDPPFVARGLFAPLAPSSPPSEARPSASAAAFALAVFAMGIVQTRFLVLGGVDAIKPAGSSRWPGPVRRITPPSPGLGVALGILCVLLI